MYNELESKSSNTDQKPPTLTNTTENRIEALKSLATLLLREVESLHESHNFSPSKSVQDRIDLSLEMEHFEIDLIRDAMIRSKGNQRAAAAILGTKATTLHAKIKRYGLENYAALGRL